MTKSAQQIMNERARRNTLERSAWNCDYAIYYATDSADWRESWVIGEDTLDAEGFMADVFREVKGNTG